MNTFCAVVGDKVIVNYMNDYENNSITGTLVKSSNGYIYVAESEGNPVAIRLDAVIDIQKVENIIREHVNHPAHYQTEVGLEAIDVMAAFTADLMGIEAVDTSNVIKYICRWKHKNGLQDLEKAKWYLEHLISHIKKEKETD